MSLPTSILVPLDGSQAALRALGCAAWLGGRLGATLHVLHCGEPLPPESALARLGVPESQRASIVLHQSSGEPAAAIAATAERHGIGLAVMSLHGESGIEAADDLDKVTGHVARAAIEACDIPVLALPASYRERLPWRETLVPVSGEPETDRSLELALELAEALDLQVTAVHVAGDGEAPARPPGGQARYSDQPHHELPQLLDEYLERASPLCPAARRQRIRDFRVARGDVARALEEAVERKPIDLVVVGWHGQFIAGHAQVVKDLLRKIGCALLLVKARVQAPFRLKVGEGG